MNPGHHHPHSPGFLSGFSPSSTMHMGLPASCVLWLWNWPVSLLWPWGRIRGGDDHEDCEGGLQAPTSSGSPHPSCRHPTFHSTTSTTKDVQKGCRALLLVSPRWISLPFTLLETAIRALCLPQNRPGDLRSRATSEMPAGGFDLDNWGYHRLGCSSG